jgi:hypothetical protein
MVRSREWPFRVLPYSGRAASSLVHGHPPAAAHDSISQRHRKPVVPVAPVVQPQFENLRTWYFSVPRCELGTGAVATVTVTNSTAATVKRYVRVKYYGGGTGATSGKYTLQLSW